MLILVKVFRYVRVLIKAVQLKTYIYLLEDVPIILRVLYLILRLGEVELRQLYAVLTSYTSLSDGRFKNI